MELFVARHGETDWNAKELLCGRTDLPINDQGRAQAEALGEKLAKEGVRIDRIIASPMLRARQTAGILAARLGVPVETEERLIEQNYGVYEGGDIHVPAFQHNKKQFAYRYPQGESMMDVAARIYPFLDALKERSDMEAVLLISHGGTIRVLNTYFKDVSNEEFYRWTTRNAEIRRYTFA